jgi:hypothetical protein
MGGLSSARLSVGIGRAPKDGGTHMPAWRPMHHDRNVSGHMKLLSLHPYEAVADRQLQTTDRQLD